MQQVFTGKAEISKRMGLSWPTVMKLYQKDGLPLMRLGLKWALDSEQLQEWMSRKSQCASVINES